MLSLKYYFPAPALFAGAVVLITVVCVAVFGSGTKTHIPPNTSIIFEVLPDAQINSVQAGSKISYSKRQFNKLQHRLKTGFELTPVCNYSLSNMPGCSYTALAYNVKLYLNSYKQVMNDTVGSVVLHREDFLHIYEL